MRLSHLANNIDVSELPHLVTAEELSEFLRIDPRTLRRWVACRKFPEPIRLVGYSKGGKQPIRWHRGTVQKFLERNTKKPTSRS